MSEITKDKRFENFLVEFYYSKNGKDFMVIKNTVDHNSTITIKTSILKDILDY